MKEHAIFMEAAFQRKDSSFIRMADSYKTEFERFFDDDPKWTPYSFRHILYLSAEIEHIKNHGSSFYNENTIDLSQIPEKYNYLVEEYNKIKNS